MIGKRTACLLLTVATLAGNALVRGAPGAQAASPSATGKGTSPSDVEPEVVEARDWFRKGSSLARSGDWGAALAAFERSAKLRPHPVTTYDIAYCERALGRYARASFRFEEALATSQAGGVALPPDLARDAETYLDEVRRRVARVAVTLRPDAATLRVDGRALERRTSSGESVYVVGEADAGVMERTPSALSLWLDPGTHVFVVATGAGSARAVESRTLVPGENPSLVLTASAPPAPRPVLGERPEVAPVNRTAAYVAFGVGGVGLVGSTVFGVLALAEKHSLDTDPACAGKLCPSSYGDRESRMVTFADFATAGLVTFLVGAGAGTYFLFTAKPSPAKSARVVPFVGARVVGVSGRF